MRILHSSFLRAVGFVAICVAVLIGTILIVSIQKVTILNATHQRITRLEIDAVGRRVVNEALEPNGRITRRFMVAGEGSYTVRAEFTDGSFETNVGYLEGLRTSADVMEIRTGGVLLNGRLFNTWDVLSSPPSPAATEAGSVARFTFDEYGNLIPLSAEPRSVPE